MCKHILFNNFKPSDLSTLQAFASMTHDRDGFGAILRTASGEIETLKSLDLATFYIEFTRLVLSETYQTVVVHHRTSTNFDGIEYAHPFEFQGHYLTHNGVVSVPGEHDTKTKNDSEALLHHLIKSGYETESIQGYFSCFALTAKDTTVLIDNTAPIYSDGRVYSSHDLGEGFTRISLVRLTLDLSGEVKDSAPIKVTKSGYGSELAHRSLGIVTNDAAWEGYPEDDAPWGDGASEFLSLVSEHEEYDLFSTRSDAMLTAMIDDVARTMGIGLTEKDMEYLTRVYQSEGCDYAKR